MNISNMYGAGTSGVSQVKSITSSLASSPIAAADGDGDDGATRTRISTGGKLFDEMAQLSQQDPAKFKTVAAQVAASLQSAAGQASGAQAQFLSGLASQFAQAAQTGSLSPPTGSQGVGQAGGSAPAAAAAQAAASTASTASTPAAAAAQGAHVAHHHHGHRHGGGGSAQSSTVQQALQGAMDLLTTAHGGSSTSSA